MTYAFLIAALLSQAPSNTPPNSEPPPTAEPPPGTQTPPTPEQAPGLDVTQLDLNALLDTPIAAVSRKEEKSSQAPAAVFVLTAEDIKSQGFRTIDDALRTVPGVLIEDDRFYPTAGIRGLQLLGDLSTRILVLVDGHPMNNFVGIGQSYIGRDLPVDIGAVERIEVIKGPVGSVYGPSAYLGVINVVTKGAERNGGDAMVAGDFGALGGEAAAHYGKKIGDISFSVNGDFYRNKGWDYAFPEFAKDSERTAPADFKVPGTDYEDSQSLYAKASWKELTLSFGHADRKKGIPTAAYSTLIGDTRNRFFNANNFIQLSYDKQLLDQLELSARASYDSFRYDDVLEYPQPPDDLGEFRDVGIDHWFSGEARATVTPFKDHRDTIGAEFESHNTLQHSYYQGVPSSNEDPVNGFGVGDITRNFTTLNAYVMVEQRLFDMVALQGGLTFYRHSLFGSRLTPKISAVITPTPEDTIKAFYTEGFRAPTMFETYFEDGLDFITNPGLQPETAKSMELDYERRILPWFSLSGSVFQNEYDRLIISETVPAPGLDHTPDPNEPTDFRSQFQNVGHIKLWGGELGANANYERYFRLYGGVSLSGAEFTGEGNEATNFTPVSAKVAVSTRAIHPSLTIALNARYTSARLVDQSSLQGGDRVTTDPYIVCGASVRWDAPMVKGLGVQLTGFNIFNSQGRDPIVADHAPLSTIPQPGTEVRLKVDYAF